MANSIRCIIFAQKYGIIWPYLWGSTPFPGFSWTAELRLPRQGRPTPLGVVEVHDWLKVPCIAFFAVGTWESEEPHLAEAMKLQ